MIMIFVRAKGSEAKRNELEAFERVIKFTEPN